MNNWLVIGVSGVTCGGKTTMANQLNKIFPRSQVISQDDYFLPVDDPRHVWIDDLNHINFDVLSSLDMEKLCADIKKIIFARTKPFNSYKSNNIREFCNPDLSTAELQKFILKKIDELQVNILIVEGFCMFNYKAIEMLCDLKYFFTLNKEECYTRRLKRVYEPPDCPGYFEYCVWPEYLEQYKDVKENVQGVKYFSEFTEDPLQEVLFDIMQILSS